MLNHELANNLYGISTRDLKQAVRRNLDRFPSDFMFNITSESSRKKIDFQSVTKPKGRGMRKLP